MNTISRRTFAVQTGTLLAGGGLLSAAQPEKRQRLPVAAVVSVYHRNSHADVIIGKILEGFNEDGGAGPALRLASLYTDQVHKADLSRDLAKKHQFRIAGSIEEAITLGGNSVAVAGVLSIAEHGDYPAIKETGQIAYPRRRFFDAIIQTFRKFKRVVPVYNDKHLAYAWRDAKHMYDTAREMNIPLMAGSSLPVSWRSPALNLPIGTVFTEGLGFGYGPLEGYGFHALEGMQCMLEKRRGGETGVANVQAVAGEAGIRAALKERRWSRELFDAAADVAPQPPKGRLKEMNKNAVIFLIEYRDGLKAALAMNTGPPYEFTFAGQVKGQPRPQAVWYRMHEYRPHTHFAYLVRAFEHMVHTGKPPYPIERTLLTTGILDAAMHSAAEKNRLIRTPDLAIRYAPVEWPFAQGSPPEK